MTTNPVSYLYQRYKAGTKSISNWLVNTTRTQSDITKVLEATIAKQVDKKSKRKKTRQRQERAKARRGQHIILSCEDLLRLSRHLRDSIPQDSTALTGIENVTRLCQDVVRGRRECSTWYAAHERDAGHEAFLHVMEQVLADLTTIARNCGRHHDSQYASDNKSDATALAAGFATLEVEEPSPEPLGDAPIPSEDGAVKDDLPENTTFELETPADDKHMSLYCFLIECHRIRDEVRTTWQNYANGVATLFVASQITFVAAALIENLSTDFISDFLELETFKLIAEHLNLKQKTSLGQLSSFECAAPPTRPSGDQSRMEDCVWDIVCSNAFTALLVYDQLLTGMRGTDPSKVYDLFMLAKSYHPFLCTLLEVRVDLADLMQSHEAMQDLGGFDPLLVKVLAFDCKRRYDPATVVLFQMQMDIFDVLGECRQHGSIIVDHTAKRITESIAGWQVFIDNGRFVNSTTSSEEGLSESQHLMLRWIQNGVSKKQTPPPQAEELFPNTYPEPKTLLARLPLFAGHMESRLLVAWFKDHTANASCDLLIAAVAHLYYACRAVGYLSRPWQDMEHLINWHSQKRFGLRDRSTSSTPMSDVVKDFELAFGMTLKSYSKERRSQTGSSDHQASLPTLSKKVIDRMCISQVDDEAIEKLWNCYCNDGFYIGFREYGDFRNGVQKILTSTFASNPESITPSMRAEWAQTKTLAPAQILGIIRDKIAADEVHFTFDYVKLFLEVENLFNQIQAKYCTGITDLLQATSKRSSTSIIINDILRAAASEENSGYRKGQGHARLRNIANELEVFIRAQGSVHYDAAVAATGGHLPHALIPKFHPAKNHDIAPAGMHTDLKGSKLDAQFDVGPHSQRKYQLHMMTLRNSPAWKKEGLTPQQMLERAEKMLAEQEAKEGKVWEVEQLMGDGVYVRGSDGTMVFLSED